MIVREFDDVFSSGEGFPWLSVVIPLYNYAHMICETLETLKQQEIRDFALIIVNDKSTDDSLAVTRQWCEANAHYFPRIRLISNRENGGLSIARNTGISATRSEYIFFLDADNMIYPRCLTRLAEALDASPAAFAFSMLEMFGGRSGVMGTRIFDVDLLADGNYIDAMAMIRREALEAVEGYRPMKYGWEDYDLWLRFAEQGLTGIQVPELLGRYRSHNSSMSNTTTASNAEAVKRQIREYHPWVRFFATPDFLPKGAISLWSRLRRYGGLVIRLARTQTHSTHEFLHFGMYLLRTYRTRGPRGVVTELRALEAAILRRKVSIDRKEVRWLPRFERKGAYIAQLPFKLELKQKPNIAVVFHLFSSDGIESIATLLGRIPFAFDLYVSSSDEHIKKIAIKSFSGRPQGTVDVQVAPFVREGFEAAFAVFAGMLSKYDRILLAHSERPGESGGNDWSTVQRNVLVESANVPGLLAAFEEDPSIGVVSVARTGHDAVVSGPENLRNVIARTGLKVDPTSSIATPEGSMFWIRPAALGLFLKAELSVSDFEELGTAAALRNLIYLACENAGFNWLETTTVVHAQADEARGLKTIAGVADLSSIIRS